MERQEEDSSEEKTQKGSTTGRYIWQDNSRRRVNRYVLAAIFDFRRVVR